MKKIRLDLETIQVASFETVAAPAPERGTVKAHVTGPYDETCNSCNGSCDETCVFTCNIGCSVAVEVIR